VNPWKVSAQFVAFMWFLESAEKSATPAEAARFAQSNWVAFLPYAHEGYGNLLIQVAKLSRRAKRTRSPHARNGSNKTHRQQTARLERQVRRSSPH
jgi:hypothetical protein